MCINLFWEQKGLERKIPWVSWENLSKSKRERGMGLRDLASFNNVLLTKQRWRILANESSFFSKVVQEKYFPNSSFLEAKINSSTGFTWRSILQARNVLKVGVRRVIGDGK